MSNGNLSSKRSVPRRSTDELDSSDHAELSRDRKSGRPNNDHRDRGGDHSTARFGGGGLAPTIGNAAVPLGMGFLATTIMIHVIMMMKVVACPNTCLKA